MLRSSNELLFSLLFFIKLHILILLNNEYNKGVIRMNEQLVPGIYLHLFLFVKLVIFGYIIYT